MSNKNENDFCIISGPGGLLKLYIMVRKTNVLTYIWNFSENWKITETGFIMRRLNFVSRYVK